MTILFSVAQMHAQTSNPSGAYSLLYAGTDQTGFSGENGQIAIVRTDGPNVVSPAKTFAFDFPFNGLTNFKGFLLSGQPEDAGSAAGNTLRTFVPTIPFRLVKTTLPGTNSFSSSCCNEQMVVGPDGFLYHAHYGDVIQRIVLDSSGMSEVVKTYTQANIVGMASDGINIWISNWDAGQVGTWDPATNTFTLAFSPGGNPGALAWDVANGVLWIGFEGGKVIPYSAAGVQLGDGFQPFGSDPDTIDGLAFIPKQ